MMPEIIKLIARFEDADTSQPVTGDGWRVRFYDHDILQDDFLAEVPLPATGIAEALCAAGDFRGGLLGRIFDRLREKKPDVYVEIVDRDGLPVYRSGVQWNVDAAQYSEITKVASPTVDLGVYRFRKGEGLSSNPGPAGGRQPPLV